MVETNSHQATSGFYLFCAAWEILCTMGNHRTQSGVKVNPKSYPNFPGLLPFLTEDNFRKETNGKVK